MTDLRLPSVNHVIISGRLTSDPNLNYTKDGTPVLKFRVASSRRFKQTSGDWSESVTFIQVVIWRKAAENLGGILKKGFAVLVEGRLQSRSWESEGQKRSIVEINAFRVQNLQKKEKENGEHEEVEETESSSSDDDDLPF